MPADLDPERLASVMKAFAHPVRVQLLRVLTKPHQLGEIRVVPTREGAEVMSRQAVSEHLQQLLAVGVIRQWNEERDGRSLPVYQVNHSQLFALTESLRELGRIHPEGALALDATMPQPSARAPAATAPGPTLIAASGAREGARFALAGGGPWLIGRAPECDVRLDYDPFVSLENTEISFRDGRGLVRALPKSRNGTRLNWEPIPTDEPTPLATGDLIGVGRTLLVWRPG